MALTSIILLGSGCEDRMNICGSQSVSEGMPVDVTFRIGLADEADAYTLSGVPGSKASEPSGKASAFSYALCPAKETKATTSLKPEKLYNLEIRQYRSNDGACIGGSQTVAEELAAGSLITATLQTATKCHLVLVAWGKGNTTNRLGTVALSEAQRISVSGTYMDALDPSDQASMNKMPYILHLTDVNVKSDGSLYSVDGEVIDIRLLLRRLAVRLNVNWTYNVNIPDATYQLDQILLQSVPLNYNVVVASDSESNKTYPSLLDQFTTIQLTAAQISAGSYSCWLPANVRGTNPAATSLFYRIKSNAPTGSTYIDFQAVNQKNTKQKLSYRVYLGSNDNNDFNLYGNRDYSYTMNFNHTTLPTNDLRVNIIDPIPASQDNSNLVPTANCFMIVPGGAFCFNPYKYAVKGNNNNPNSLLQSWCSSDNVKIKSVKVLWQTKENGDVGDPVLGVVSSATDHTNIVALTEGNSFENARIYCRVAPNTTGGSGVIAAYDDENGTGNILWSWHIWVTDYNPSSTGTTTVLEENKRKLVYKLGGYTRLPMMDRNLGAVAGYVTVPKEEIDRSKANGLMYQWGRKDPYRCSYTNRVMPKIPVGEIISSPMEGILSCYRGDGITFATLVFDFTNFASDYQVAYRNPERLYTPASIPSGSIVYWYSNRDDAFYNSWGMNGNKGLHDPCPSGWRVCSREDFYPLYSKWGSGSLNLVAGSNVANDGGYLISYNDGERSQGSYYRLPGYWMGNMGNEFGSIGTKGYFWTRENGKVSSGASGFPLRLVSENTNWAMQQGGHEQAALLLRCIQEQE